ncbi:YebC/PmpR family DNA-binding transcriptional regulator [Salibacter halophilus]|uniref:Probable transcriptional regulatory protein F3059_11145 n=1 Tax=Salibacter halophilus TaxID=1803916 RepID=A0A6N6M2I8_9FLAO|nr:YebC/PmpR family DNA-binding transcriptional regulator [Salibacter halophilus]KAB1063191.1 YebC/PmpR family DNA-binding transcriptional regulator [Salibacter halophilus]
MAGHSKWANIKHRKGAQDKKRAKIFTRLIKEITVAVKESGPEEESNPRLRLAVQNAKGQNMPKDTIERAIKKASGADGDNYTEVHFEGYAPNGIAVVVETTTDNNNRTVSNVRSIFNKYGGSLGTKGSLEFIFDRKGVFEINREKLEGKDLEELEMELIDAGLEEMDKSDDEVITLYTSFDDFGNMNNKLEELDIEVKSAEVQRIPNNTETLDVEKAKKVLNVIEKFEEDDDVNTVYHNLELTDELQQALEEE